MSDQETRDLVILTGAGFSKAFGLPQASEFNNFLRHEFVNQNNSYLLECMEKKENFEKIYSDLQKENNINLKTFHQSIKSLFEKINNHSKEAKKKGSIVFSFRKLINDYFDNNTFSNQLYYFTLNQDLLLENLLQLREGTWGGLELIYPGICYICQQEPKDYKYDPDSTDIEIYQKNNISRIEINMEDDFLERFDNQKKQKAIVTTNQNVKRIYYCKLHGSSNWIDQGSQMMIMGDNKSSQIAKNKLLSLYSDVFKETISGKNLLVIGYSFNDENINNIIFTAAKEHDTKIHYLSPDADEPSNKNLSGMGQYIYLFPYKFEQLLDYNCQEDGTMPFEMKELRKALNFRDS